jgi:hypothetical protein
MRPAKLADAMGSFASYAPSALLANVIVAGAGLGLLVLMTRVPAWAETAIVDAGVGGTMREVLFTPILVIVLLLSVLVWIVVGLCWLLTPAIVVEESSWLGGIREWRQLLREQLGRIVVYEGLTILLGIAISLPLCLAVGFATHGGPAIRPVWPLDAGGGENWSRGGVIAAIQGLTAGPLLALLPVANVFIYLNLRYEQSPVK